MQDKIKISGKQAILLILMAHLPTAVLFVPGQITTSVSQDTWMSLIMGAIFSVIMVYFPLADLGKRYPEQTILQYSEKIMGKFLGKLISLVLVYFLFMWQCWTLRESGELIRIISPKIPIVVSMTLLSLVTVYAAYNGLEVIARCSEFLVPIGMVALLLVILFNVSNMDLTNLLPVMEFGIRPLLRGSLTAVVWFTTASLAFGFISPNVNNKKQLKNIASMAIALGCILLTGLSIINISVFGAEFLKTANFALLQLAQFGKVTSFFQRLEPFIIILWLSWIFMRVSIFTYAATLGIAQSFNLAEYRFLLIPEAILAIAYSNYIYDSFIEMSYLFMVNDFYFICISVGIPLLLWISSLLRCKFKQC